MTEIFKKMLLFFYPKRCVLCGALMFNAQNTVCNECYFSLPDTDKTPVFPVGEYFGRQNSSRYFYSVISPFYYTDCVRKGIIALKFHGRKQTALFFASYMADTIKNNYFYSDVEAIVYVPASNNRLKKRGFNQCLLLAEEISRLTGITLYKDFIIRKKDSPPQSLAKDNRERLKNVKDVFVISDNKMIKNKKILLVDDIITTGATLNECAKALVYAGASQVLCVTAAIAHHKKKITAKSAEKTGKILMHRSNFK